MDIKEKIEEIVAKLQGDEGLRSSFASDPIKAIEGLLGVDLPDEAIKQVIDGVKEKLGLGKEAAEDAAEGAAEAAEEAKEGILDKIKGIFSK